MKQILTVLLVEDSPTDVLLAQEAFESHSQFQLTVADRLSRAMELLSQRQFDIVLLDLGLPDSQGLDTLDKLRKSCPAAPIIVMTARDDKELAIRSLQEGAQDYLVKSQTQDDALVRAIRYAFERNSAKQTLQEREELFRSAFENTSVGMVLTDIDNRFVRVNDSFARMFGFAPAEVVGMTMADVTHPDDIAVSIALRERLLAGEENFFQQRKRYIHRDGHFFWGVTNVALVRNAARKPIHYIAQVQDVTEHKRAEEERDRLYHDQIRSNEAFHLLDRAIQSVSQGILITDARHPDNPIVFASPSISRITGYGIQEFIGRNCRFLQGRDTDDATVARIREAIRGGKPCNEELLNYRKDGTPFWNELTLSPVMDEGGVLTHFVGIQTDVTERRSLEAQFRHAQKMEAFGQLAGGVAHDFNNLLTIISGYSDIILSTAKRDDPIQEFAKEISGAAERAASLTRQLLAFSRKAVLDPKVLDLNEVVRETGKMLRRLIGEDILLTTVFDPTISRVKVDPDQLGQVLMNLTVNARDAMPRGGNLTVETKAVELDKEYARLRSDVTPGKYVLISVSDSGFGMTPKVKARLFEPFFTTKGVGKGTGLGLAVVMGIVKQSGGHVAVYSEPDHGTTFKLYFPAVEELVDEAKPQSLAETMRGTETVLLVEDEEGVRGLAFMVLQSRGYKVLAATDGKDALRVVARHPGSIDILVTDVVMPGMGGRELAETLQPRYPQMKVLYTSGYTDDAVVRHGIVQAESAFLQKPYTPLSLSKKVRQVLEQR